MYSKRLQLTAMNMSRLQSFAPNARGTAVDLTLQFHEVYNPVTTDPLYPT